MRTLWVGAVLVLASACGRSSGGSPAVSEPCAAPFAQGEFATDFAMVTALSVAPAVGETATFTVGVCAKEAARATLSVHLYDGVTWRTPPAGTTVTAQPWVYGGCEDIATGEWDLPAMTPLTLVGTVVATKTGTSLLEASAGHADAGHPGPAHTTTLAITVGADRASSYFGLPENSNEASASSETARPVPVCT